MLLAARFTNGAMPGGTGVHENTKKKLLSQFNILFFLFSAAGHSSCMSCQQCWFGESRMI